MEGQAKEPVARKGGQRPQDTWGFHGMWLKQANTERSEDVFGKKARGSVLQGLGRSR